MTDIDSNNDANAIGSSSWQSAWNKDTPTAGSVFKLPTGDDASGMDAFKNWLGPKQYKEFINNLCQSITNSMKDDEQKADLARRKLAAVEKGEDPDEVTE